MREECVAIADLESWLTEQERTQAWLAKALGVSAPSVNAWFARQTRPQPHLRETIEVITNGAVTREGWLFPSEIKTRDDAIARAAESGAAQ